MTPAMPRWLALLLLAGACTGKQSTTGSVTPGDPDVAAVPGTPTPDAPATLPQAEASLAAGEPARAVALFSGVLARDPDDAARRQAYPGLARAHEQLGDFAAAIRAYDEYLTRFAADAGADVYAARGACHAELGHWQASADDFGQAAARAALPSAQVEYLARQGYAMFELGKFAEADPLLAKADQIFMAAQDQAKERFTTFYFVGMARFYRAAIHHRNFREVQIRLPEKTMAEDFARKFALLEQAQDGYNHTIKARHVFWVSAAGYQMGTLFEEFYDAVMHAPVPDWLDDNQRRLYYEELKNQLRPVVNKAIWVFEKNLETSRKLGYDSAFIAQTETKLSDLQAILLAGDTSLGKPHPPLAPEARPEFARGGGEDGAQPSPVDRKLFVPEPTPL
jgi:tetratricopeptide (TPR) repeat protein